MKNYLLHYVVWIESVNTDGVRILLAFFSLVPNEVKENPWRHKLQQLDWQGN
jgi:hypothetical protein